MGRECPSAACYIFLKAAAHLGLNSESVVDFPKLREKCNEQKGDVEDEEKDPVAPAYMEPPQWDSDEGQDQRQTQRSHKNPRQQSLYFKLRMRKSDQSYLQP